MGEKDKPPDILQADGTLPENNVGPGNAKKKKNLGKTFLGALTVRRVRGAPAMLQALRALVQRHCSVHVGPAPSSPVSLRPPPAITPGPRRPCSLRPLPPPVPYTVTSQQPGLPAACLSASSVACLFALPALLSPPASLRPLPPETSLHLRRRLPVAPARRSAYGPSLSLNLWPPPWPTPLSPRSPLSSRPLLWLTGPFFQPATAPPPGYRPATGSPHGRHRSWDLFFE
ncbi:vegetative cell wall protein gp1-like [Cryptomeria japonica]|uniref:vegetative cell wall protein gp1-like n=1 Tax=Cryptomeria japonica TaxID=3369 RepID=UPI0027D9D37B|nr:vegetative cell wall protein gp1-like [Cryptomeria japonica]